jgi:hypothetical protein
MADASTIPQSGFLVQVTTLQLGSGEPMFTEFVVAESDPSKAEHIINAVMPPNEEVSAVGPVSAEQIKVFGLALRWHSRQRASCEAGQTVRALQVHGVSELIKQHAPDAGEAGLRRRPAGPLFFPAWRLGGADPARTDTPSASSTHGAAAPATSDPRSDRARALP